MFLNIGFILSFLEDRWPAQKMTKLGGKILHLSASLFSLRCDREERGLYASQEGQTQHTVFQKLLCTAWLCGIERKLTSDGGSDS